MVSGMPTARWVQWRSRTSTASTGGSTGKTPIMASATMSGHCGLEKSKLPVSV